MAQIIFQSVVGAVLAIIGTCVCALWKNAEKRQDELKSLITNIQTFLNSSSKEAGVLTERVANNTKDIVEINSTIKSICEDNKSLLSTVREQNSNIERVLNEIKKDNAVQEARITALERAIETMQASAKIG